MIKCLLKCFRKKMAEPTLTQEMIANRYSISSSDCETAGQYLEAYLELEELDEEKGGSYYFTHREGLLVAAIVSYSRAFTESRGQGRAAPVAKVNMGQVFDNDTNKIQLHKLILHKRNKAVAHADWEFHQSEVADRTVNGVLRRRPAVIYGQGIDIPLFKQMSETMCQHFRYEQHVRDIGRK